MSLARQIPDAAKARQIAAADPERSVFVSANAGSGKTHVLVQRVINLLLRGEDPAKILCITFTKAAAANMATRVFNTLAEWTALDDDALDAKIRLATGKAPDAARRAIARRLFANAAGNAGRTEGADHSRVLHTPVASISVRGRRGSPLRGARRGRNLAIAQRAHAGSAAGRRHQT